MIPEALQTNALIVPSNFSPLQTMLAVSLVVWCRPVPSFNPYRASGQFPCRKIADQIAHQLKVKSELSFVSVVP